MPPIDRRPTRPHPTAVAGDLAIRGEPHGAATIRDLLELAQAQEKLIAAYRTGIAPANKALQAITKLKYLLN